jgi:RNA polymerase sigma-70 factor (ECF subfamily)
VFHSNLEQKGWLQVLKIETAAAGQPIEEDDIQRQQKSTDVPVDIHMRKIWKESFKGFYKKYSRGLWFYIYRTCGDENLADDIFQETFYKYLRADPIRLKLNEFQQKAYLYKTATRLVIDQKRKVKRIRQETYPGNESEESREYTVSLAMDMEKLFNLLKPKERTLLWLAYVEGYTHSEIAAITDCLEKSIKVQLHRVRKKFAGILKQEGFQEGDGVPILKEKRP